MALKVVWTKRALQRFRESASFVEEKWGEKIKVSFISQTLRTIELIQQYPEIGIMEDRKKGIRSFFVSPYHRLFYRTNATRITILNVFAVRMDPDKKLR